MTDQVEQTQATPAESATATEVATPQPGVDEQNTEGLLASGGEGEELQQEQQTEPDLADVEYDGETFKVPPKLKDAFLRFSDYTRKTQEVAEQRKAIETEREQVKQSAQLHQQMVEEISEVKWIDRRSQQLQQVLSQVNWQALTPEQQPQAMALQAEFTQLQARRGQLNGLIAHKEQQRQLAEQQETATLFSKAEAYLKREIKDWDTQKLQIADHARSLGIDTQRLQTFMLRDPQIVKVFEKAAKYDQSLKKLSAKPPAPPAAPITKVTPQASPATQNPDKMNPEEWRAWREKQLAQRRNKR